MGRGLRRAHHSESTDVVSVVLVVVAGVALLWLTLVVVLWRTKPDEIGLRDAVRLLPDVLRLLKRLAADPAMPKGVRVRLGLLLAYLALPFDVIPDFIPVLGYVDDALIVALTLRSVARRAGPAALSEHWPGTPDGLTAVRRFCRIGGHEQGI
ncbi:MAG: YkvA family protein [Mycobacterium sp.]